VKGLILSGGAGTRLRPITHTNAKQLVPIANKPILFYGIEGLVKAGITDIGIIIGETGNEIQRAVGDGSFWNAKITYIQQEQPLGLAHCVLIAKEFLGDDDFMMHLGDNMLEQEPAILVEKFIDDRTNMDLDCRILLKEVQNPSSFGIATIGKDGEVTKLVEKPKNPSSNLALVGVYLFTRSIHTAVEHITPSNRGELEITDAIQWLIDDGNTVDHDLLKGWWIDTGKKDPLLDCNRLVLDSVETSIDDSCIVDVHSSTTGPIVIGRNSSITNSTIKGPVAIGENVIIQNSEIGPYVSIGDNCSVEDTHIDNSVILQNCLIRGSGWITTSLLGRSCSVTTSNDSESIVLMLGDDSVVELS